LLDVYRIQLDGYGSGDEAEGAFAVPSPIDGQPIRVIASSDAGWDHVSVSRQSRCPNWPEMEHVRRLFFKDDETMMQLHPPLADYVNDHPYCLHLWRPRAAEIPRPPKWMVGGISPAEADALLQAGKAEVMADTPDNRLGDAPIEGKHHRMMNTLAGVLDEAFKNAERADVVKLLEQQLARFKSQ
jgi:hypothetical protein